MQMAVIEFARNVLKLADANSTEFDEGTEYPIIGIMLEQKKITVKGGTMRLGAYPCAIKNHTKMKDAYELPHIGERHRHRYEFNYDYKQICERSGMVLSCPDCRRTACSLKQSN